MKVGGGWTGCMSGTLILLPVLWSLAQNLSRRRELAPRESLYTNQVDRSDKDSMGLQVAPAIWKCLLFLRLVRQAVSTRRIPLSRGETLPRSWPFVSNHKLRVLGVHRLRSSECYRQVGSVTLHETGAGS